MKTNYQVSIQNGNVLFDENKQSDYVIDISIDKSDFVTPKSILIRALDKEVVTLSDTYCYRITNLDTKERIY